MLHSLYRVYWENAYIDELTGLYNRRALDERLARLSKGYSIAMVDIDHFKNFNDTYGHEEGDNVLRLVAKILKDHFGASAFRYGGEEFCIIFRRKNAKDAAALMNEARLDVASHGFSIRRSQKGRKKSGRKKSVKGIKKVKLSFSSGIASPGISRPDPVEVLKNADNALYTAKNNGRNRVEITRNR
ncbi:MAG: GGDEF domain-containing protein [Spirochaetales bacterium]|uniref:diguanylate cyclase n=1 Tax=Candidatus Thalassospirochaeta sargassi TaxID=3119039 RepID=A0AAJ1IL61_9SPIO|nr:GGDEF domain-containing protein [Spirochaetales bacterium]